MFDVLKSYDFIVVVLGTSILAISSGIIGCFSLYKGQSLIGDAIGHAAYPGVILAFMFFQSRNPIILLLGSILTGAISYAAIQLLTHYSKVKFDSALAVVLTGFFGLGMVLKTYIQGNPKYTIISQSGLKSYIFGSAAFLMYEDVCLITAVSLIVLFLLLFFRKQMIITIFDREFAKSIGLPIFLIEGVLLVMMITMISIGLKMVGTILISSFLIIPCICANQHSKKLRDVLAISALTSLVSSIIGTYLSSIIKGFSTGASIVVVMSFFTILSFIFGKYGLLRKENHLCKK